MKAFILFCYVVFVSARANVDVKDRIIDVGDTYDVNYDVDQFLPIVVAVIEKRFNPLPAPDMTEGFYVQPLWVEYRAQIHLSNGKIHNAQTMRRAGDAVLAHLNGLWRIRLPVAFEDLVVNYDYHTQVMDIGPRGGVISNVDKVRAVVDILYDKINDEYHIQDFEFESVGKIRIRLTGNVLTDWLVGPMVDVITTLFKGRLVSVVQETLKDELQAYLNDRNSSPSGKSWLSDLSSSTLKATKEH